MDATEFDGKDLEDALARAARSLGRDAAELEYEIVEGGRKGVFGLGARPVRIRVAGAVPRTAAAGADPGRDEAPAAHALREIIRLMGFRLRVDEARRDGVLELTVDGPDLNRMTAKDGELLQSVEFVLNRMGRRAWPDESTVHVLARGFRSEREDELVTLVRDAVTKVSSSGVPAMLHEMNPYERRVVHMTVREHPGLTTVSCGDGFMKRIRVEKIAPTT